MPLAPGSECPSWHPISANLSDGEETANSHTLDFADISVIKSAHHAWWLDKVILIESGFLRWNMKGICEEMISDDL